MVEDICGQFTQAVHGRAQREDVQEDRAYHGPSSSTTFACDYYTSTQAADGKDAYLLLVLNYLNVAQQKAAQETLGRTVTTNASIPMDNWVSTQDNGVINAIYFVLGTDKFMRLDRSSTSVLSDS